ncbi:MAG: response regulator, partial [Spirulinaceae cyanobacterium]
MASNQVLIIDNKPKARTQIQGMLPGGNFEVVEVSNRTEAQAIFEQAASTIRLVVFKFELPKGEGWEILKTLQTTPSLQKVPVVIYTANRDRVEGVVPDVYFEYVELLAPPLNRKIFQKGVKSAIAKTKRPRQELPLKPKSRPKSPPKAPPEPPPVDPVVEVSDNIESVPGTPKPVADPFGSAAASIDEVPTPPPTSDPFAKIAESPAETPPTPEPSANLFGEVSDSLDKIITPPPETERTEETPESIDDILQPSSDPFGEVADSLDGIITPPPETEGTEETSIDDILEPTSDNASVAPETPLEATSDLFTIEDSETPDVASEPVSEAPEAMSSDSFDAVEVASDAVEVPIDADEDGAVAAYPELYTPYDLFECCYTVSHTDSWNISCLAIALDGETMISGSESDRIKIWNLYDGSSVAQWSLLSKEVSAIAISPDNQMLLTGAKNTNIKCWDLANGELLSPFNEDSMGISCIAIALDNQTVITASHSSNIKLWDLATGQLLGPLNDQTHGTTALALSPDN